jgi:hypothetical protein
VDFNVALPDPPHAQAAAYALTYISSPADRTIVMAVESDDDAIIWLNGQRVYRAQVARGIGEADTLTLRLARGVNRLLYKVVNRTGGFGVGGRVLALSRPDRRPRVRDRAPRHGLAESAVALGHVEPRAPRRTPCCRLASSRWPWPSTCSAGAVCRSQCAYAWASAPSPCRRPPPMAPPWCWIC